MIGAGGHLHPGGLRVMVENLGQQGNPCRTTGCGTADALLVAT